MTRNFLVFIIGSIILLVFSFAFAYSAIYMESLVAGILSLVGFVGTLCMTLIIGIASKEDSGTVYIWFFTVAIIAAILFIWFITRAGVLLQIW